MPRSIRCLSVLLPCLLAASLSAQTSSSLGLFEGQSDVGAVTPPGTAVYDPASGTYTLTAAGANLWGTTDAFHFVWKKVSGDFVLTADIAFPETSGEHSPHRKALLMIRQTLDAGSVYADAAQHGVGLMALQYRRTPGAITGDIELAQQQAPHRLRLEKRGDTITMDLSMGQEPLHPVGASIQLHFDEPFYVGLGLCAHDPNKVEKAVFSHVTLEPLTAEPSAAMQLYSTLQTVNLDEGYRRAVVAYTAPGYFEAPNWSKDGRTLIFDQGGRMMTVPAGGGTPQVLDTGDATHCNGSHGISPDGRQLAITCSTPGKPEPRVYLVPIGGGTPQLVTDHPWSFFHSWSSDGQTIIFTRPDHGSGNIFAISAHGGAEHALTTGTGISDDPDEAPDGQWIYFNSDRGGSMQIWRMHSDGSGAEQITHDDRWNWTPHVSPDGKWIVYISYPPGTTGHPSNRPVELRLMSLADRSIRTLVHITGGSGTMNVSSWAPDSRQFAFVSYQMLPAEAHGSQP